MSNNNKLQEFDAPTSGWAKRIAEGLAVGSKTPEGHRITRVIVSGRTVKVYGTINRKQAFSDTEFKGLRIIPFELAHQHEDGNFSIDLSDLHANHCLPARLDGRGPLQPGKNSERNYRVWVRVSNTTANRPGKIRLFVFHGENTCGTVDNETVSLTYRTTDGKVKLTVWND